MTSEKDIWKGCVLELVNWPNIDSETKIDIIKIIAENRLLELEKLNVRTMQITDDIPTKQTLIQEEMEK